MAALQAQTAQDCLQGGEVQSTRKYSAAVLGRRVSVTVRCISIVRWPMAERRVANARCTMHDAQLPRPPSCPATSAAPCFASYEGGWGAGCVGVGVRRPLCRAVPPTSESESAQAKKQEARARARDEGRSEGVLRNEGKQYLGQRKEAAGRCRRGHGGRMFCVLRVAKSYCNV